MILMEKTKTKVRKKFKFKKFIFLFLLLYLIIYFIFYIIKLPIKNIYIKGTNVIPDKEIIEVAKIKNYPSIFRVNSFLMKKRIKKINLVKDVKISKNIFGKLTIDIDEAKMLFIDNENNVVLENGEKITNDNYLGLPTLTSNLENKLAKNFCQKFAKVNQEIISLISEIEYSPAKSEDKLVNKYRFIAYMNDGNIVYFDLININNMNLYPKINSTLDNAKGTLYLDSSNEENFLFEAF